MTLFQIVETFVTLKPSLSSDTETELGFTPLHTAMESGNLEVAMWIMAAVKSIQGLQAWTDLVNKLDKEGMRPMDLLAFRVDNDHKLFLQTHHAKNYRVKKQFQAYSWGRSDDLELGYPLLSEERKQPKRIQFCKQEDISIRDIVSSRTFSLALSQDGKVYSWGRGTMGHLGNGQEESQVEPSLVPINLAAEKKKIKAAKKQATSKIEDVEDLLFFQNFLKHSGQKNVSHAQAASIIEQQCVIEMQNLEVTNQKLSRPLRRSQYQQRTTEMSEHTESFLALLKMDRVCVTKIACSNKHSLVCTNTGAVYSWGQNSSCQLGFPFNSDEGSYCAKPSLVQISANKAFFVDVACGDDHSLALTSQKEVFVWGKNRDGQCGFDPDTTPQVNIPRKLNLREYMNTAHKEDILSIKAHSNYTVLVAEQSRNVYVSSSNSEQPFVPLFGKQQTGNGHKHNHLGSLKKLEPNVCLSDSYILAFDQAKSIYLHCLPSKKSGMVQSCFTHSDRKIAIEVFGWCNFISLHATEKAVWAVNSLRQLLVCKGDPFEQCIRQITKDRSNFCQLAFEPCNKIFNVMTASMGQNHQVVVKIVKKLDELMLRDLTKPEEQDDEDLDPFEIPVPSFSTGTSIEVRAPQSEFEPVPSLRAMCTQALSTSLTTENALSVYDHADFLNNGELKVNCLKFIALNVASFFESAAIEKLFQLPVYLIRELENFLKVRDSEKFKFFSMSPLDFLVENQIEQADPNTAFLPSIEFCQDQFNSIEQSLDKDQVMNLRNTLRKALKKNKRFAKDVDPDLLAAVQEYLERTHALLRLLLESETEETKQQASSTNPEETTTTDHELRDETIIILKKPKKGKHSRFGQKLVSTHQEDPMEKFVFLSKEQPGRAEANFVKSSLAEDFVVVQQSQKRSGKVVHLWSTQKKTVKSDENQGVTLSSKIGYDEQALKVKEEKERLAQKAAQIELTKKLFTYLGEDSENQCVNKKSMDAFERPKCSFEEIMREELKNKPLPRRSQHWVDPKLGADFHTKRAWGMAQELPKNDFAAILEEEEKEAERNKAEEQLKADEALALKLQKELAQIENDEEEQIRRAIAESLQENLSPRLASNCLKIQSAPFVPMSYKKKRRFQKI